MNIQNYNTVLAQNRADYQNKLQQTKNTYKEEIGNQKNTSDYQIESLKQSNIRDKRKLENEYTRNFGETKSKMQKTKEDSNKELKNKLTSKQIDHSKETQRLIAEHKRQLDKTRNIYEVAESDQQNNGVLNHLQKSLRKQNHYYAKEIGQINDHNSDKVEVLHQNFNKEKEEIVNKTDKEISTTTQNLKKKYFEESNKANEYFQKRLREKELENDNLLFRLNLLSKKINKKFTKELEETIDINDEMSKKERIAMKGSMKEKDLVYDIKLNEIKRNFTSRLHELSMRNEQNLDNIIRRYETEKKLVQKDHTAELEKKTRVLETTNKNLKESHQRERAMIKGSYEHQIQNLKSRIAKNQRQNVSAVSK